jgi:hypothetical protein
MKRAGDGRCYDAIDQLGDMMWLGYMRVWKSNGFQSTDSHGEATLRALRRRDTVCATLGIARQTRNPRGTKQ